MFSKDTLLDNVMIYYLTNSITTSCRLYLEGFADELRNYKLGRVPVPQSVPVCCAHFRNEPLFSFDWQLNGANLNLVQSTYHSKGGHYIALERPDDLYKDFIAFVNKLKLGV